MVLDSLPVDTARLFKTFSGLRLTSNPNVPHPVALQASCACGGAAPRTCPPKEQLELLLDLLLLEQLLERRLELLLLLLELLLLLLELLLEQQLLELLLLDLLLLELLLEQLQPLRVDHPVLMISWCAATGPWGTTAWGRRGLRGR
ncbi:hypothetical protein FOA52_011589 [Chlamydomonas sp. UWO 241]|nr:hypothetical protein FOA52_011589 [Chlamydomonas sp. UWO 241]